MEPDIFLGATHLDEITRNDAVDSRRDPVLLHSHDRVRGPPGCTPNFNPTQAFPHDRRDDPVGHAAARGAVVKDGDYGSRTEM